MSEVTLVIPFHNREKLLPRMLASLAATTVWPSRVVFVDNNSTDGSKALCEAFAKEHPNHDIRLVCEPTPGAPAARNCGLSQCETDFVYFFDSDDELSPTFFADILPYLNAGLDLLAVPTRMKGEGKPHTRAYRCSDTPEDQILLSHLSTQAMVIRTDFLRKVGGWNDACPIWNDWELGLRLLLAKPRMKWLTSQSYHTVYVHADSLTGASLAHRAANILQTMSVVAKLPLPPAARKALFYRFSILSGQFSHQGNAAMGKECDAQIRQFFGREPARFLRWYASTGGRGAWLIARSLL